MSSSFNPFQFFHKLYRLLIPIFLIIISAIVASTETIPLPEHPRPDFCRDMWLNLNGNWDFQFDSENCGLEQKWFNSGVQFKDTIQVPFPWGSKLSGVEDLGNIAWYKRTFQIPPDWKGQTVFLVIGACDWLTTAWIDGHKLGEHQGGFTPFEFELTEHITPGQTHHLTLRMDDSPLPFKLEGKQGYGRAAGIWQTVYLEARPQTALEAVHFTPDIDNQKVTVIAYLDQPAPAGAIFEILFKDKDLEESPVTHLVQENVKNFSFAIPLPDPHLWSLDDPYLYEVQAVLKVKNSTDRVSTYFGMRKISTGKLPGTDYSYVMLNNKPIYLQLTLDQAYHPEGFYTFPSDEFMRDEILRTRSIGLNGQRIHVKIGIPRKLYWADRLGVLIMADVPNSWGEPDENMRKETEYALRQMIKRDYNHPAIFSWVNFNETWGLFTRDENNKRRYLPETQQWVEDLYLLTKKLDPTRLVEDNSPCNYDHVATDINTWHSYLPGYTWKERLDEFCRNTYPGSTWNFVEGRKQGDQPMFNSECGNVWGYQGSAGDVDWSWDYHLMINQFRRHPKCSGWLYTEHHDVINEWNGYWRYDRSEKYTGLEEIVEGMSLNDLHSSIYIALEHELCTQTAPGSKIKVPMFASFMTDLNSGQGLILETSLSGWDTLGNQKFYGISQKNIPYQPWMNQELEPLEMDIPEEEGLMILAVQVKTPSGQILHRNFTTYLVKRKEGTPRSEAITYNGKKQLVIRFDPNKFSDAQWSLKQWEVLGGLKVNGAGYGYFEYRIPWPAEIKTDMLESAVCRLELSAKQLFGKDRDEKEKQSGDFMRGGGTHDPSLNQNAYPMTDTVRFPSQVRIRINGYSAGIFDLPDDPADHRGILSWFSQKRDRYLREAGSYGYLVSAIIPKEALQHAAENQELIIRLEVDDALPGGLAVYGERFGRYPIDPMIIFTLNKED